MATSSEDLEVLLRSTCKQEGTDDLSYNRSGCLPAVRSTDGFILVGYSVTQGYPFCQVSLSASLIPFRSVPDCLNLKKSGRMVFQFSYSSFGLVRGYNRE